MVTRRAFLAGLGSAALVFGFDPVNRRWISEAHAAPFDRLPRLDGSIVTDPASLAAYARDAGNIVHNTPIAVLRPGSVRDIQRMLRFCKQRRIQVAARGQGHTTFGQAQVAGGLVIDMATLNQIHSISADEAVIDAGATWRALVDVSAPSNIMPPVLTGYINLSIGGTLSVGGVSTSYGQGSQVDHVRELEVVTGTGDLKRCSAHQNADLFQAALAGLGQCGVITRATIDMVRVKPSARVCQLNYFADPPFFQDLETLLNRGEFDDLFMLGVPDGAGGWVRQLNAVKFFGPGEDPDPNFLLRGLTASPSSALIVDQTHHEYVLRVDVLVDFLKLVGLWNDVLHPWFDVWVPDDAVEPYVTDVLAGLTPEDVGATGFLLLLPQRASRFRRRFFKVPECSRWIYLFDILTAAGAPGPDPEFEARMLERNRILFEQARDVGGKRYPIGTLEFSRSDWKHHYGHDYDDFERLKQRYDPSGILSPGSGIF